MSKIKSAFLFLILFDFAHGQSTKYFRKVIGLPAPFIENGFAVKQFNNGYLIGGERFINQNPNQEGDALIVRANLFGNKIWEQSYTDTLTNIGLRSFAIVNNSLFFAGWKEKDFTTGKFDAYFLKTDTSGNLLLEKSLGDTILSNQAYMIASTLDGGFILAGYVLSTNYDANIIKIDSVGIVQFDSVYIGPYMNVATWIEQEQDSSYIFAGFTNYVLGSGDACLTKLDKNGNTLWKQTYHQPGDYSTLGICVKKTLDNGYIVSGYSGAGQASNTGLIFKTDSLGNQQWMKKVYNESGDWVLGDIERVVVMPDSTFVFAGTMAPTTSGSMLRMLLMKTDANGNTIWMRRFTNDPNFNTYGFDMVSTSDGGFIISGRKDTTGHADIYLVKTNCLGFAAHPNANFTYSTNGNTITFVNTSQWADSCIYFFGDGDSTFCFLTDTLPVIHTYLSSGNYAVTLVVYACGETDTFQLGITTGIENLLLYENTFTIQPNPAKDFVTADYFIPVNETNTSLSITSLTGKEIKHFQAPSGKHSTELNIEDLSSGIYFLNLTIHKKTVVSRKLVLIK